MVPYAIARCLVVQAVAFRYTCDHQYDLAGHLNKPVLTEVPI
jgi:hypothetical protein